MKWIITIIVLCFFLEPNAQDFKQMDDTKPVFERLRQNSAKVKSLKCNFEQTKLHVDLGMEIKSKGMFYFQKQGSKIRWEYTEPSQFVAIFANGDFAIKGQEKLSKSSKESEPFQKLTDVISTSLNGNFSKVEGFEVLVFESGKVLKVRLKPTKSNSIKTIFKHVDVFYSQGDYKVSSIQLQELNGDIIDIRFLSLEVNPPISARLFSLK